MNCISMSPNPFKDPWSVRIKWFVVKWKNRIQRGQHWISFLNPLIYFLGLANMNAFIKHPEYAYIIALLYILVCIDIGWFDEIYGIWKMESTYGSKNLNPFFGRLDEKINKLLRYHDIK